jgi:GTP cyclohydrolase II
MAQDFKTDLTNTEPAVPIPFNPAWVGTEKIVSLDPWGHLVWSEFKEFFDKGVNIQPTIAVTKAHICMPELEKSIVSGSIVVDNTLVHAGANITKFGLDDKDYANITVTKCAVEHVWWLPGVAKRFGIEESQLRRALFEETAGMFPELITRSDLEVFLPPVGGLTVYIFGDAADLRNPEKKLAFRVHDECNGSDVFGSDICTCRPYLVHGVEGCVRAAQTGGVGLIVYCRKEGRALGEVTKFLVYNARKRQEGGDRAATYFLRTECVAGVQDMRFQELMPDVLHWLGVRKIHELYSMSDMKHDAIVGSGIEVVERISIPDEMIPEDARVEMDAKMAAGYFTTKDVTQLELEKETGRRYDGIKPPGA